jgi:hypothetical protein
MVNSSGSRYSWTLRVRRDFLRYQAAAAITRTARMPAMTTPGDTAPVWEACSLWIVSIGVDSDGLALADGEGVADADGATNASGSAAAGPASGAGASAGASASAGAATVMSGLVTPGCEAPAGIGGEFRAPVYCAGAGTFAGAGACTTGAGAWTGGT